MYSLKVSYCIQPNYHTVHLGFSKILGKLVVKYVSTNLGYTIKKNKTKISEDSSDDTYAMFLWAFFPDFLHKIICLGTHLNCSDSNLPPICLLTMHKLSMDRTNFLVLKMFESLKFDSI